MVYASIEKFRCIDSFLLETKLILQTIVTETGEGGGGEKAELYGKIS